MPTEEKISVATPSLFSKPWHLPEYLEAAGPGVITGAADDDPSGIGTYTMAGAKYGHALLWSAILTWPMMAGVQLACARVGMVTGRGLASAFSRKLPRPVLLLIAFALFAANTLNVAADFSAMADAARLLTGGPGWLFVFVFATGITWATIFLRYNQIAKVLKWLALVLFAYVIAAFVERPDWTAVLHSMWKPSIPGGKEGWGMLVAILGTTISPYLFFWQASQEVEEEKAKGRLTVEERRQATPREFFLRKVDVTVGMFFSNVVMFFIILTSSLTLHAHGLTSIESSSEAAQALAPIAGRFAAFLYMIGLVGTGLLAIPTLTGSSAYAFAEIFHWKQGLDEKWRRARAFYAVIAVSTVLAVLFDFLGFNPLKALYWSAVVNGALSPFLLVVLFMVICDTKIMEGQTSPLLTRLVVGITALLMFVALVLMFITT